MSSPSIVIVGAGVLGLTTASVLQNRHPRARITIVAAEIPLVPPFSEQSRPSPDYASMWAGAHLRSEPGKDGQLADEQRLVLATSKVMRTIARLIPEAGVQMVAGREIMEYIPDYKSTLKTGAVYTCDEEDDFRVLDAKELDPGGEWGCEYQTWIVNVLVYCRWLLAKFIRQGGNLVQRRLERLEDAFELEEAQGGRPRLVINCSARNFDTDPKVNVIRGQTVLVRNSYHKTATRHNKDGTWSFLIPRPLGGGTIVGGTKQMGDWGTDIRPTETKAILENAARCWPGFVSKVEDFEIMSINVGRRPFREGGLRIEREQVGQDKVVVHGYGAGARGYELSWGAAERIVDLVSNELSARAKL